MDKLKRAWAWVKANVWVCLTSVALVGVAAWWYLQ